MSTDRLLLDTHVWIWLLEDCQELSPAVVKRLDSAAKSGGLFVSAISVWELATLAAKGRLRFPVPLETWVDSALRQPGMRLLPLSPAISLESARLVDFHGDPADRILVASARLENLVLVTRDRKILEWAIKSDLVHVQPA